MRVLVIHDQPITVRLNERILNKLRCESFIARSGASGIACFEEVQPDVVLIGMALPDMDVLDLIKHIRKQPGAHCIPVILLANPGSNTRLRTLPNVVIAERHNVMELAGALLPFADSDIAAGIDEFLTRFVQAEQQDGGDD